MASPNAGFTGVKLARCIHVRTKFASLNKRATIDDYNSRRSRENGIDKLFVYGEVGTLQLVEVERVGSRQRTVQPRFYKRRPVVFQQEITSTDVTLKAINIQGGWKRKTKKGKRRRKKRRG